MFRIETSIRINRPPEEVFDFVVHPQNIPRWQPKIKEIRDLSTRSLGGGTRFSEVLEAGFFKSAVSWEITEFNPNTSCTFESDTFIASTQVIFSVDEVGDETVLKATQHAKLNWPFRIMEPLLKKTSLRARRAYLTAIKKVLETEP